MKGPCCWLHLSVSVAKHVASRPSCQFHKRPTTASAGILHTFPCPPAIFQVVGVELYGPVTPTDHRWIVIAADHLTGYVETSPLRTDCAYEVADIFLQGIVLRYMPPRLLLRYLGRIFLSAVLAEVL